MIAIAVFAATIAVITALAWPRSSLPMDHAYLDTDPRDQRGSVWASGDYNPLLGFAFPDPGINAVSFDQRTHSATRLPGLIKAITDLIPSTFTMPGMDRRAAYENLSAIPAPNGRWVLMTYTGDQMFDAPIDRRMRRVVYIVRADGKQVISVVKNDPEAVVFWLTDSRHWVEVTDKVYCVHDLAALHLVKRLPIIVAATPRTPSDSYYTTAIVPLADGGWAAGGDWPYAATRAPVIFWRATVGARAVVVRPVGVVVPPSRTYPCGVLLSPTGDRAVWSADRVLPHAPYFAAKILGVYPPLLRSLAPLVFPSVQHVVWVSRLDGSDVQQIGASSRDSRLMGPFPFGWSQDGKRLLFDGRTSGTVYAVPVPEGSAR